MRRDRWGGGLRCHWACGRLAGRPRTGSLRWTFWEALELDESMRLDVKMKTESGVDDSNEVAVKTH